MKPKLVGEVDKAFNRFVNEFLLKGKNILTHEDILLTREQSEDCMDRFILNYHDEKNKGFDTKLQEQFLDASYESKLFFAHMQWLWSFAVHDINIDTKKGYVTNFLGKTAADLQPDMFPEGFGNAGQWHTNNKYFEISFVLQLVNYLLTKIANEEIRTNSGVREWIEYISLYKKYKEEKSEYPIDDAVRAFCDGNEVAMANILLYLSNSANYERIASTGHKNRIVKSFRCFLDIEETKSLNTDKKIGKIREVISTQKDFEDFDFYNTPKVRKVWNYSLKEEGFSEIQGLQYKKAIILYGPPGTSKTYSAIQLAEAFITHHYLKNKESVRSYFTDDSLDLFTGRIHTLQLHQNYSYEDFVAGYQLHGGDTKKSEGILFQICEKAAQDNLPHFLILDEINRVDISRLFGELFSAIENRGTPIEVGIGGLTLAIPGNLYFIGTMNEIDFSLERIDFALRRRFLWFFYGYSKDALWNIIHHKNKDLNTGVSKWDEVERFVNNATKLNEQITSMPELGKEYQIGHTFFAEIIDVYKSYLEIENYKSLQKQFYRDADGPVNTLWDISIKPIIEAFLGNVEPEIKEETLKRLHKIYSE